MAKSKNSKKKVFIIVAIVLVVIIAAIVVAVILNKNNKVEDKPEKKVEKKEPKLEVDDNLVYYVAKLKYKDGNVKSIETYANLHSKEPCYVEDFTYKNKKLVQVLLKDNEYEEVDEKRTVTYDNKGNMVVEYGDDNILFDKSNQDILSVKQVDSTGSGYEKELARVNYVQGKVAKIVLLNDGDKANYEVIEYTYDSKGRISSIKASHPYRKEGELYIEDDSYNNLTVTFKHSEGVSSATVKEDNEEKGMFLYYYKDGMLDYVQMCSITPEGAEWLGDIHGFPGKKLWSCILDIDTNPIFKMP